MRLKLIFLLLIPLAAGGEELGSLTVNSQLTLATVVEKTFERNPQQQVLRAGSLVVEARTIHADSLLPTAPAISLRHQNDTIGSGRKQREWEAGLEIPIWLPGQRVAREAVATEAQSGLSASRAGLMLTLAGQVRDALWDIAMQTAAVDLAQSRLNTAETLQAQTLLLRATAELKHAEDRYWMLTGLKELPSKYCVAWETRINRGSQVKVKISIRKMKMQMKTNMEISWTEQLRRIVKNIIDDNEAFVKSHKSCYYKPFEQAQYPRATVITCSDSRIQSHALDKSPDGNLFFVRNIGNQLSTAEGSVEYGVQYLHTPLLLIIGHVACGAIKAARLDYSKESPAVRRELDTIKLPKRNPKNSEEQEILRGVDANVNNQVSASIEKFKEEVKEGTLTVIGAIYDFQNVMKQDYGRLIITNINGDNDSGKFPSVCKTRA